MSNHWRALQKAEAGLFAAAFLAVWLCGIFSYQPLKKANNCEIEIVAHRGDSFRFPENTMAAFRGASDAGADYAELDVRQTSDGVLVVMHDSNLLRTVGIDREICDVTYHELRSLKVKKPGGFGSIQETIPTLQEVLQFLKNNSLMLKIELKPCGKDGYEKEVVNSILEANMQNRCLVASSDCKILQRVKSYAPEIRTAYVGCDFKSSILRLQSADVISLNANCVDAHVVQLSHSAGKPIYVWTINTKQMLDKVIALGVDGVITNNPSLAIQRTYFVKKSPAA
ncbi:glycerophosphodiester phosphodiesterase family protein [Oscillibacter sp.]|uniref:glycerophosphodiester phosphodiesterase n=1 Tax=Oscillibacter sp. TaxID=1945593 RepID=UPI0028B13630|nr:glycerophosphodiester phosphodiesterase family protein [Oscillibacter sp.]